MLRGKSLQAVQAMEKTLELLDTLARCKERLPIGDLAEKLALSRREVRFLLITLEAREMLRWDGTLRAYRPGRAALDLARGFLTGPAAPPKVAPVARIVHPRSSASRQEDRRARAAR